LKLEEETGKPKLNVLAEGFTTQTSLSQIKQNKQQLDLNIYSRRQ
jgi:hypothetical protein